MAIRSAMNRIVRGRWLRRWRRQHQRHGEDRSLSGTRAVRGDVPAHAARELPRYRESEARSMGDAFTAAAVVQIEQLVGSRRGKSAALIADVESPAAIPHGGREPHAAAAILVGV